MSLRVRYSECDPMNVAHHSVYPVWLELARCQWLRDIGASYRDLEQQGIFFVVAKLNLRYRQPAKYDDQLTIVCTLLKRSKVSLEHEYVVQRGEQLLATAQTTLVCVDRSGVMQPIPAVIPL